VLGRHGVTLLECLVVLVILGIAAGVSLAAALPAEPSAAHLNDRLAEARQRAIHDGQPVSVIDDKGGRLLCLPDGEVLGAGVDPLTGGTNTTR
jgi:prepilin-type N-terminal cleavage/methylation domain-containing protein